ncbi:MAG: TonB-dependent receptor [Tannerellaceae bacterium]|jgi:hypothetical protein|nr:TonB-dependent receptor [Tannerellaceae bacterium]
MTLGLTSKTKIIAILLASAPVLPAAQERIRITGYVRDGDGNPIELATVLRKNTLEGAVTDEKGYYTLATTPADSLTLIYSCLGYNKAERIIPSAASDMRLNVRLNPLSLSLGEVSVTASRKQINTMETLRTENIKLIPDPAGGSIESLVVTYAGVSSANELSSQYSVRGGSYDENIVYVNGLEVFRPLLIRSGQQEGLSFVNPDLTESVEFAAGGFGARYGDKMSSVLDITYKKPQQTEGSASASLLGTNIYIGSASGTFTQVTGFRYKTSRSLLSTMDTRAEYDPVFIDLQSYMTWRPADKWEVNFLGNLSANHFRFTPHSRETSFGTTDRTLKSMIYFDGWERDRFQTLFGAITLKHTLGEYAEMGLQLSAFNSREEETYDISGSYWVGDNDTEDSASSSASEPSPLEVGTYHEHARNRLFAGIVNLGHYGSVRTPGNTLQWGAAAQWERISDRISEWERRDSAGYSLPHRPDGVYVISNLYSDNNLSSTRLSAYLQDVFRFRSRQGLFTLTGGVRGSYWTYNAEYIFSPRASLGFIPNFNRDLTFRVATGLYYQPPFYKELRRIATDPDGNRRVELNRELKSQRSLHFILGGDYAFRLMNRNFKLTTEVYYKKLDFLNPYTIDNVKIRYYAENCAEGYVAGIDMKLFGELVPGTDSWLSLSLLKAEQTIRQEVRAPLPNNPGYNVTLFFQDYFPGYERIKLTLRGILSGRLPVTVPYKGYEDGYYRTTPYRRVDLGMSYRLGESSRSVMNRGILRRMKHVWVGVDVFNLFDISNVNSYMWITDVYGRSFAVPNYLTGRQLNLRLIVDF